MTIIKRKIIALVLVLIGINIISFQVIAKELQMDKLSEAQLKEYNDEGILLIRNFFSKDEVSEVSNCAINLQQVADTLSLQQTGKVMHEGTQFVIDRPGDKIQIHRIVWAGAMEPKLLRLGRQQKLLVKVGQILDSKKADHLINQLHYKLPNDGVQFGWHQDIKNRKTFDPLWADINKQGSFVQTIIAIDPMLEENSTIYYVPKSHKRGDLYLETITDDKKLSSVAELDKAVPLIMHPGDIVFMHPYLVHGSEPNTSEKPRKVFINGFSYPGANKQPYPGIGSAETISLTNN